MTGGYATDKTYQLRMARDVDAKTMASALSEAVGPRLGKENTETLSTFENLVVKGLDGGSVKKNMVLRCVF